MLRKSSYLIMLPNVLIIYHRKRLQWYTSLVHRVSTPLDHNATHPVLNAPVVDDRDISMNGAGKLHPAMGNPFTTGHLSYVLVLLTSVPTKQACDLTSQATSLLRHALMYFFPLQHSRLLLFFVTSVS